jgi:hypothetical protein
MLHALSGKDDTSFKYGHGKKEGMEGTFTTSILMTMDIQLVLQDHHNRSV